MQPSESAAMATLQEVECEIKEIAAKITTLKAAGGADPALIKQHVVSEDPCCCLDRTTSLSPKVQLSCCVRAENEPLALCIRSVYPFMSDSSTVLPSAKITTLENCAVNTFHTPGGIWRQAAPTFTLTSM